MANPRSIVVREPSYMTKEEPPTYEISFQHQQIEQGQERGEPFYSTVYPPLGGAGAPGASSAPQRSSGQRGASSGEGGSTQPHKCVQLAMPPLHMKAAVFCLVCNFVIPGLGTIIAGASVFCCGMSKLQAKEKVACCCLCLSVGVFQLLLTPAFLIGWVWSILWGFAFVGTSNEYQQYERESTNRVVPIESSSSTRTEPRPPEQARSPPPPYVQTEEPNLNVPSGS